MMYSCQQLQQLQEHSVSSKSIQQQKQQQEHSVALAYYCAGATVIGLETDATSASATF